jgi:hypothetical protein
MRSGAVCITGALALASLACATAPAPSPAPLPVREFVRAVTPFEVRDEHGEPYDHPFLGGFVVPRPQFVDINGNGLYDLFVQERADELMYLENVGSATEAAYVWRTDRWKDLSIGEWARFVDVDGNGLTDLLSEERYDYIRVYRNEGTPEVARLVQVPDSLRNVQGRPIFADRQNIPAFHGPRPAPAEYAALLRISAEAIRSVDPGARIISGGIVAATSSRETPSTSA